MKSQQGLIELKGVGQRRLNLLCLFTSASSTFPSDKVSNANVASDVIKPQNQARKESKKAREHWVLGAEWVLVSDTKACNKDGAQETRIMKLANGRANSTNKERAIEQKRDARTKGFFFYIGNQV